MFNLRCAWLFAEGGVRRSGRAGWLLAISALLCAALPPTAHAQCPTGCTLSSGDVSGTLPTLYIQSTGTAHGTGAFNFGSSSQFLPRTATTGSLPSSCTICEYLNFGTSSLTAPYLCQAANQWVQFPLLDAATNGNLAVPGHLTVGPTTGVTGEMVLYGAGGAAENLTVPSTGSSGGTITMPFGTANMLTDSLQATVTNKILQDSSAAGGVVFGNATNPNAQLAVDLSAASPSTTTTLAFRQPSSITVSAPTASSAISGTVYAAVNGGTVNDGSGTGKVAAFPQQYSLPPGLLTTNKLIRVTASFSLSTTGAGPPGLAIVLQFATSNIAATTGAIPSIPTNGEQATATWIIQGTATPNTSVDVQTVTSAIYIPGICQCRCKNTHNAA